MKLTEMRSAIFAGGHVATMEGLDDDRQHPRLIQFEGLMTCGLKYSGRATRHSLSLEVRTPEEHQHQDVQFRCQQYDPKLEDGRQSLEQDLQTFIGWLAEFDRKVREAPPPVLLSSEDLARIREAVRSSQAAEDRVRDTRQLRDENEGDAQRQKDHEQAQRAYAEAKAHWKAVFEEVYTWDTTQ